MKNPYLLNTHDLPRRAGEMKEYELDIAAPARVGVPLIGVAEGDIIEVDARLESVTEGVLLSAEIYALAHGECIRCLDPIELEVERTIQELYRYEPARDKNKGKHRDEDLDLEAEDELQMEGDVLNLENPIIDAIILALPINPLCDEECLGLCPDCGEKWESLPDDHAHDAVDPRWSGLKSLLDDPSDFGNQSK
jgi:uncharacterized protein